MLDLRSNFQRTGVSRFSLLGALITTIASANAVLPLVAQQEIVQLLGDEAHYQTFLNAVTLISVPFLLSSSLILRGLRNRSVCQVGFLAISLINFVLFFTDLSWHPLLLRSILGVVFGLTIPMGQFIISQSEMEEGLRVNQFTMMLNLVAVGLSVLPFLGISILWISGGHAQYLFLFLAILAFSLVIFSSFTIPESFIICPFKIASLKITLFRLRIAIGDILTICLTRSAYALVLVWLSHIIQDFSRLQSTSLFFTVPFVVWGFLAIPLLTRLKARYSMFIFLILPIFILALAIKIGVDTSLPLFLILIALLSIPEAFTPGQLVSQWDTPSGRQFGNVLSMALMTICLSLGPMFLTMINRLSAHVQLPFTRSYLAPSMWLILIIIPLLVFPIQLLWGSDMIKQLRLSR
ncbi:hypothetical protein [Prochlorococcus marinus]|uniref:MFS transporter n=1 Tax=Prochlorococcus marinus (strain MIT 9303) TaxID=59922 RepID=A2CBF3_PROM3|nr:hypothetical protein [Prochlorococcus marinus]ABM78813.1 Hypothetical protein P9303_20771 [Prochlorococcus marinus str. MIT 9303]